MKEEIDINTGNTHIQLSDNEVKIGFLSQCIEVLADAENCHYIDMLNRLEKADMTEGYILSCYDTLHTQSWDIIISELKDLLHTRESDK